MINNKILTLKKFKKQKYSFLNLDVNQTPSNKFGQKFKDITFVGPASEGTKFFHHTLSRPDKKQFNIIDLENWVERL